jgi:hypothetical protein
MPRAITSENDYRTKLLKLIPAEIVAAYISIDNIVPEGGNRAWLLTGASLALLIILPFYLRLILKVASFGQIAATIGSYLVWVYSLGGPFNEWDYFNKPLAAVILILWTAILPFFKFNTE